MVNFVLRKIFRGNLSETVSLTVINVNFKVTSISGNSALKIERQACIKSPI